MSERGKNRVFSSAGNIKVKVLKKNGKVKKTRKLKKKTRSVVAGKTLKLKLKLNRKTKKLVKKAMRRKKASKALIKVRATDAAGNSSKAKRRVKVKPKRRR